MVQLQQRGAQRQRQQRAQQALIGGAPGAGKGRILRIVQAELQHNQVGILCEGRQEAGRRLISILCKSRRAGTCLPIGRQADQHEGQQAIQAARRKRVCAERQAMQPQAGSGCPAGAAGTSL